VILKNLNLKIKFYSDESGAAFAWWQKTKQASQNAVFSTSNLGAGLIFGDNAQFFAENMYTI